jgi:salicylate hydroxylase
MLPFLAQGAAQAIEDGVVLSSFLSRVDSPAAVPAALQAYEAIRRPRVTRVQAMSAANKVRSHLPDGDAQRERDAAFASGADDLMFSAWDWLYRQAA